MFLNFLWYISYECQPHILYAQLTNPPMLGLCTMYNVHIRDKSLRCDKKCRFNWFHRFCFESKKKKMLLEWWVKKENVCYHVPCTSAWVTIVHIVVWIRFCRQRLCLFTAFIMYHVHVCSRIQTHTHAQFITWIVYDGAIKFCFLKIYTFIAFMET